MGDIIASMGPGRISPGENYNGTFVVQQDPRFNGAGAD